MDEKEKQSLIDVKIHLFEGEKRLLDSMTPLLHQRGYIPDANRSAAVRYCIRAICYLLFREIEGERYGGEEDEY